MNIKQIKDTYQLHNQSLYGAKNIKDSVAMLYQENSKLTPVTDRIQGERIAGFRNPYFTERSVLPYKMYPEDKSYSLKEFVELSDFEDSFTQTIHRRRSVRDYDSEYKVSLFELSQILHFSYGINHQEDPDFMDGQVSFRYVPSGGGLYPLEIYVALFNSHLEPGLYHYNVRKESLIMVQPGNHLEELRKSVSAEPWVNIKNASGMILITGIIERQIIKYGERSYRFMLQEVGFVSQMISLLCEKNDFGSCMCGMYLDDAVNDFIGIDGVFETVQNTIVFGKKKS